MTFLKIRRFFLAGSAKVVFESPDLNMGDVQKALTAAGEIRFPAEFEALGPFFTDVKLIGRVSAKLDNSALSYSMITLEGIGQAGVDVDGMELVFDKTRCLCEKLGMVDEPTAWLLMADLAKHQSMKWIAENDELTEAFRANKPFSRTASGPILLRAKI